MDIREALETGSVESFFALLGSNDGVVEQLPCNGHVHNLQCARVGRTTFQWLSGGPHTDGTEEIIVAVHASEADAIAFVNQQREQVAQLIGMAQFAAAITGPGGHGDFMVI